MCIVCIRKFESFAKFNRLKGDLKQHETTDNQQGATLPRRHSLPVTFSIFLSRLAELRLEEVEEPCHNPSPLRQVPRVPW